MLDKIELLGLIAAAFTSIGFFPQLIKICKTKSTKDISTGMYGALCIGFSGWIVYGVYHRALSIVVANVVSLCISIIILMLKLKIEARAQHKKNIEIEDENFKSQL